ncbi:MAG: hypothetical protein HYV03_02665 [Deltaproteobacteria bacterium]|nr:hypothetical protein [Deltaproteobacteria bacterium]
MPRTALRCLAVFLGLPLVAMATMVVPRSLAELTARADVIVAGRVVEKTAAKYVMHISELLKGSLDPAQPFRFEQAGGVPVPGSRSAGAAILEVGEEYLLFLKRSPAGQWVTVGMEQGRFRVVLGPDGKRTVVNGFRNQGLFPTGPAGKGGAPKGLTKSEQAVAAQPAGPLPYDELLSIVRKLRQ